MRALDDSATHSKQVTLPTHTVNIFSGCRLPLLAGVGSPQTLTLTSALQQASRDESALQNLMATTAPPQLPLLQLKVASSPLNNPCTTATLPSLLPEATQP